MESDFDARFSRKNSEIPATKICQKPPMSVRNYLTDDV